jgi:plasmid stabilization system protein ParE
MAKIVYDPEAVAEIREAADYYEKFQTGLGQAFLNLMESAIDNLLDDPLRWRKISGQFRRILSYMEKG